MNQLNEDRKRYLQLTNIDENNSIQSSTVERKIPLKGIEVGRFIYLGSIMTYDLHCKKEIKIYSNNRSTGKFKVT